jgi:hypothetical protein
MYVEGILGEMFLEIKWSLKNLARSIIGFTSHFSIRRRIPTLVGEKMDPGVAYTGFFIARAASTVIRLHDFSPASGRNTMSASQAIKRFLCGNVYFVGCSPSLYSESIKPPAAIIFSIIMRSGLLRYRPIPHPRTAIVGMFCLEESV